MNLPAIIVSILVALLLYQRFLGTIRLIFHVTVNLLFLTSRRGLASATWAPTTSR